MLNVRNVVFKGRSNRDYSFNVYDLNANFNEVPAVYSISKREIRIDGNGWRHTVLYFGITNNLKARLNDHHKLADCIRQGANCISVHQDPQEVSRIDKEADLIAYYQPPLNDMLKQPSKNGLGNFL